MNKYDEKKELSLCESPIEVMLFQAMRNSLKDERNRKVKVYSQVPCGYYRIDLAVYSKTRKIAIECDGKAYHSTPEQIARDRKKDKFLRKNGWDVLRFTGSEIYNNPEGCVKEIQNLYDTKKSFVSRIFS